MFERYEGDNVAIFHGNCMDILANTPKESVDLVFADPPYNIGKKFGDLHDAWESDASYAKWCYECSRLHPNTEADRKHLRDV